MAADARVSWIASKGITVEGLCQEVSNHLTRLVHGGKCRLSGWRFRRRAWIARWRESDFSAVCRANRMSCGCACHRGTPDRKCWKGLSGDVVRVEVDGGKVVEVPLPTWTRRALDPKV